MRLMSKQHFGELSGSGRLARYLSDIFNPLFLSTGVIAVVLSAYSMSIVIFYWTLFWLIVITSLMPLATLTVFKKLGLVQTLDIDRRDNRMKIFFLVGISYLLFYEVLHFFDLSLPLVNALLLIYIINMALSLIITLFWKISIHNASLTSAMAVTLYLALKSSFVHLQTLNLGLFVVLAFICPLMLWSRHKLGVHTWPQCFVGAASGFSITWLELSILVP